VEGYWVFADLVQAPLGSIVAVTLLVLHHEFDLDRLAAATFLAAAGISWSLN
jgi:hypothetical protein